MRARTTCRSDRHTVRGGPRRTRGTALTGVIPGVGVALLLAAAFGGCSSSGDDATRSPESAAQAFADAVAAGDAEALCAASAVAGEPAADDPSRSSLCQEMLASMFLDLPDDERAAFGESEVEVTVDGSEASAVLNGTENTFTVKKIDDAWYVVVG